jgi:hypothetical protein
MNQRLLNNAILAAKNISYKIKYKVNNEWKIKVEVESSDWFLLMHGLGICLE